MTLRSITSPLDSQTLTEWRTEMGTWLGLDYTSGLSDAEKTEIDRLINEAHEYVDQRFGHEPWATSEESLSLASGTATLTLSAAVRHVMLVTETYDSKTRVAKLTTKLDYMRAWGAGADDHPWSTQTEPRWFFDGMDDSNPPQQQWKRVPTPDQALTGTALVRPYFELLGTSGSSQYTLLPPHVVAAVREHVRYKYRLFRGQYNEAAAHRQAREDEIAAMQVNDNLPGAMEAPSYIEVNDQFLREMNL